MAVSVPDLPAVYRHLPPEMPRADAVNVRNGAKSCHQMYALRMGASRHERKLARCQIADVQLRAPFKTFMLLGLPSESGLSLRHSERLICGTFLPFAAVAA